MLPVRKLAALEDNGVADQYWIGSAEGREVDAIHVELEDTALETYRSSNLNGGSLERIEYFEIGISYPLNIPESRIVLNLASVW